jgi:hypothetical protein
MLFILQNSLFFHSMEFKVKKAPRIRNIEARFMDGRYQQFQYRDTSFVWPEFLMIKEILGNIFYNIKIFQLLNIISFTSLANDQSFKED